MYVNTSPRILMCPECNRRRQELIWREENYGRGAEVLGTANEDGTASYADSAHFFPLRTELPTVKMCPTVLQANWQSITDRLLPFYSRCYIYIYQYNVSKGDYQASAIRKWLYMYMFLFSRGKIQYEVYKNHKRQDLSTIFFENLESPMISVK